MHNSYHDVPFNEALPKLVTDFGVSGADPEAPTTGAGSLFGATGRPPHG